MVNTERQSKFRRTAWAKIWSMQQNIQSSFLSQNSVKQSKFFLQFSVKGERFDLQSTSVKVPWTEMKVRSNSVKWFPEYSASQDSQSSVKAEAILQVNSCQTDQKRQTENVLLRTCERSLWFQIELVMMRCSKWCIYMSFRMWLLTLWDLLELFRDLLELLHHFYNEILTEAANFNKICAADWIKIVL